MKGLKDVKYTDQWFQDQANQLRLEPSDRINHLMLEKIGPAPRRNTFFLWITSSAAAVCLLVATHFYFQSLDTSSMETAQVMDVLPTASNPYDNQYSSFLSSSEYQDLVAKYDVLFAE